MNYGKRCHFANQCEIYKGKKQVKEMPLFLYRNVFCNRGEKGWNNCKQYLIYQNNAQSND